MRGGSPCLGACTRDDGLANVATMSRGRVLPSGKGSALLLRERGDPVRGKALLDEAETLARETGDLPAIATTIVDRGFAMLDGRGDANLATTLGEESLSLFEAEDIPWGITASRTLLARAAEQRGDLAGAEQLNSQLMADFRRNGGDPYQAAHTLYSLGTLARRRGDDVQAATF